MTTTHEIRNAVVAAILAYAAKLPLIRRPAKLPAASRVRNATPLSELGLRYSDRYALGLHLHHQHLCRKLETVCTGHWMTVEDVVTAVIAHPLSTRR